MDLPNTTVSQTIFQTNAEKMNASLPLKVKGNISFRNRIAMQLSNPVSRRFGKSTRQKVEAKLLGKRYTLQDSYRSAILDKLRNKTRLMDYIFVLRQKHKSGADVSLYIEEAKKYIKKTASVTITTWEKESVQLKPNSRDAFYELLSDPKIYLGELIDISKTVEAGHEQKVENHFNFLINEIKNVLTTETTQLVMGRAKISRLFEAIDGAGKLDGFGDKHWNALRSLVGSAEGKIAEVQKWEPTEKEGYYHKFQEDSRRECVSLLEELVEKLSPES
ncbi:MAG: hypothetical protein ABJ360_13390 [Roseobacter sp.]